MLKEIQNFLKLRRAACLSDIANHVNASPDAVAAMLDMLASKNRIRRVETRASKCGGCTRCAPQALVVWEWCG